MTIYRNEDGMIGRVGLQIAGDLIQNILRWREQRQVVDMATSYSVHVKAPAPPITVGAESAFSFQNTSGGNVHADIPMETDRAAPLRIALLSQLDAQIAAFEAELAKLGVTAD